ncbi:MAG: tRNA (adenine-N1)-methyltransferase [Desulfurococcaceae archaeon]
MELIREGNRVLVLIDDKRRFVIRVERGKVLGTDKGYILHDDIVGLPYGSVVSTSSNAPATLLKPMRHDFIFGLKRKTQIIHPKDAALMLYLSGIGPGSRVGEAGVGTGSLTIALASVVGDEGKVYGFDISEDALKTAGINLEAAGLSRRVILSNRDVREAIEVEPLDAFFLDMPDPWDAVVSVGRALKASSPILVYVPTVNQVEKTVIALRESKIFQDIHAYELLLREYHVEKEAVRPLTRMIGHTGYIVFARRVLEVPALNV